MIGLQLALTFLNLLLNHAHGKLSLITEALQKYETVHNAMGYIYRFLCFILLPSAENPAVQPMKGNPNIEPPQPTAQEIRQTERRLHRKRSEATKKLISFFKALLKYLIIVWIVATIVMGIFNFYEGSSKFNAERNKIKRRNDDCQRLSMMRNNAESDWHGECDPELLNNILKKNENVEAFNYARSQFSWCVLFSCSSSFYWVLEKTPFAGIFLLFVFVVIIMASFVITKVYDNYKNGFFIVEGSKEAAGESADEKEGKPAKDSNDDHPPARRRIRERGREPEPDATMVN